MKRVVKLLMLIVIVSFALLLVACNGTNSKEKTTASEDVSSALTIEQAYAYAESLGFNGSLSEFVSMVSGKDGKDGKDGVGITSITISAEGHLLVTLTDTKVIDCGALPTVKGDPGETGRGIKNTYVDEDGYLVIVFTDDSEEKTTINQTIHEHETGRQVIVAQEPTCEKTGITYIVCKTCGEVLQMFVTEKTEHAYEDVVTSPTCTERGYTTHTCVNCGSITIDTFVPATGHTYADTYCYNAEKHWHPATCGHTGVETKENHTFVNNVCSVCGYTKSEVTPLAIKVLPALTDYGRSSSAYAKTPIDFHDSTYDGHDVTQYLEKLETVFAKMREDVENGDANTTIFALLERILTISTPKNALSTLQSVMSIEQDDEDDGEIYSDHEKSLYTIFSMATADGFMERLAQAAISYEEMCRVINYLYGMDNDSADVEIYLMKTYNDNASIGWWNGKFADGQTKWVDCHNWENTAPFNSGWSLFEDLELYNRLLEYSWTADRTEERELAEENAEWQYRSILNKIYSQVALDGDAAARLVTYMLDYAIEIVEAKSGGNADDALTVVSGDVTYGSFADYCMRSATQEDPYYGLLDHETLSFLLAFNEYYNDKAGLADCVTLFGYAYDYNKAIYFETMADEEIFAKQVKYAKQELFTNNEWLDYVTMQRRIYERAYRYSEAFYTDLYAVYFEFQGIIEDKEASVFQMQKVRNDYSLSDPRTTYMIEMRTAITKTGQIDSIAGHLALCDWLWAYAGSDDAMRDYNRARTQYVNGQNRSREDECQGQFYFQAEQLKVISYLLTSMTDTELSGCINGMVYEYSADMIKQLETYLKEIVYIQDGVEDGAHYTSIDPVAADPDVYAMEKIGVLYEQTYMVWYGTNVKRLGDEAGHQNWQSMNEEILAALNYDYVGMEIDQRACVWQERCERLEDLVIAKVWSCCGQKVHEARADYCWTNHAYNADGSKATQEYDTEHDISLFIKNYKRIIDHTFGEVTVSFVTPSKGYETNGTAQSVTYRAGYKGDIAELRRTAEVNMAWDTRNPVREITVYEGEYLSWADNEDLAWWNANKTTGNEACFDSHTQNLTVGGQSTVFTYTYTFAGWYLDENCKYKFNEYDEIMGDLIVYAGYNVTKSR